MADKRYKLTNCTKHDIGLTRPSKVEENIHPTRFVYLTMDEIEYEAYVLEQWLRSGELKTDDPEVYERFGIDVDDAIVAMSDAQIMEKFKLPLKAFTTWLQDITDDACLHRIYEVACVTDTLPIKKMEIIESKTGLSIQTGRKNKGGDA